MLKLIQAGIRRDDDSTAEYVFEAEGLQADLEITVTHRIKGDTLIRDAESARKKAINLLENILAAEAAAKN